MNYQAVIFDLDGVLVSTQHVHFQALNRALTEVAGFAISVQEHIDSFNGLPTKTKLEMLIRDRRINAFQIDQISELKQKYTHIYLQDIQTDWSKVLMMQKLYELNIRIGCVTNAIGLSAKIMLERVGVSEYIQALVTNEDIRKPKPSPEGYVKCMDKLCVEPHRTLILEDSKYGIEAAKNSCATVLEMSGDVTCVNWNTLVRYII